MPCKDARRVFAGNPGSTHRACANRVQTLDCRPVKCVLNYVSNRLPRQARTVYSLRAVRGKRAVQSMRGKRVARGMRGARCKQLVRLDVLGPCVHVLNADQAHHLHGAALLRKLGAGRGDVVLLGAVREEHHAALPIVSAAHIADAR